MFSRKLDKLTEAYLDMYRLSPNRYEASLTIDSNLRVAGIGKDPQATLKRLEKEINDGCDVLTSLIDANFKPKNAS
jgi:hypothetical protein